MDQKSGAVHGAKAPDPTPPTAVDKKSDVQPGSRMNEVNGSPSHHADQGRGAASLVSPVPDKSEVGIKKMEPASRQQEASSQSDARNGVVTDGRSSAKHADGSATYQDGGSSKVVDGSSLGFSVRVDVIPKPSIPSGTTNGSAQHSDGWGSSPESPPPLVSADETRKDVMGKQESATVTQKDGSKVQPDSGDVSKPKVEQPDIRTIAQDKAAPFGSVTEKIASEITSAVVSEATMTLGGPNGATSSDSKASTDVSKKEHVNGPKSGIYVESTAVVHVDEKPSSPSQQAREDPVQVNDVENGLISPALSEVGGDDLIKHTQPKVQEVSKSKLHEAVFTTDVASSQSAKEKKEEVSVLNKAGDKVAITPATVVPSVKEVPLPSSVLTSETKGVDKISGESVDKSLEPKGDRDSQTKVVQSSHISGEIQGDSQEIKVLGAAEIVPQVTEKISSQLVDQPAAKDIVAETQPLGKETKMPSQMAKDIKQVDQPSVALATPAKPIPEKLSAGASPEKASTSAQPSAQKVPSPTSKCVLSESSEPPLSEKISSLPSSEKIPPPLSICSIEKIPSHPEQAIPSEKSMSPIFDKDSSPSHFPIVPPPTPDSTFFVPKHTIPDSIPSTVPAPSESSKFPTSPAKTVPISSTSEAKLSPLPSELLQSSATTSPPSSRSSPLSSSEVSPRKETVPQGKVPPTKPARATSPMEVKSELIKPPEDKPSQQSESISTLREETIVGKPSEFAKSSTCKEEPSPEPSLPIKDAPKPEKIQGAIESKEPISVTKESQQLSGTMKDIESKTKSTEGAQISLKEEIISPAKLPTQLEQKDAKEGSHVEDNVTKPSVSGQEKSKEEITAKLNDKGGEKEIDRVGKDDQKIIQIEVKQPVEQKPSEIIKPSTENAPPHEQVGHPSKDGAGDVKTVDPLKDITKSEDKFKDINIVEKEMKEDEILKEKKQLTKDDKKIEEEPVILEKTEADKLDKAKENIKQAEVEKQKEEEVQIKKGMDLKEEITKVGKTETEKVRETRPEPSKEEKTKEDKFDSTKEEKAKDTAKEEKGEPKSEIKNESTKEKNSKIEEIKEEKSEPTKDEKVEQLKEEKAKTEKVEPTKEEKSKEEKEKTEPTKEEKLKEEKIEPTKEIKAKEVKVKPTKEEKSIEVEPTKEEKSIEVEPTKELKPEEEKVEATKEAKPKEEKVELKKEDKPEQEKVKPAKEDKPKVEKVETTKEDKSKVEKVEPTKEDEPKEESRKEEKAKETTKEKVETIQVDKGAVEKVKPTKEGKDAETKEQGETVEKDIASTKQKDSELNVSKETEEGLGVPKEKEISKVEPTKEDKPNVEPTKVEEVGKTEKGEKIAKKNEETAVAVTAEHKQEPGEVAAGRVAGDGMEKVDVKSKVVQIEMMLANMDGKKEPKGKVTPNADQKPAVSGEKPGPVDKTETKDVAVGEDARRRRVAAGDGAEEEVDGQQAMAEVEVSDEHQEEEENESQGQEQTGTGRDSSRSVTSPQDRTSVVSTPTSRTGVESVLSKPSSAKESQISVKLDDSTIPAPASYNEPTERRRSTPSVLPKSATPSTSESISKQKGEEEKAATEKKSTEQDEKDEIGEETEVKQIAASEDISAAKTEKKNDEQKTESAQKPPVPLERQTVSPGGTKSAGMEKIEELKEKVAEVEELRRDVKKEIEKIESKLKEEAEGKRLSDEKKIKVLSPEVPKKPPEKVEEKAKEPEEEENKAVEEEDKAEEKVEEGGEKIEEKEKDEKGEEEVTEAEEETKEAEEKVEKVEETVEELEETTGKKGEALEEAKETEEKGEEEAVKEKEKTEEVEKTVEEEKAEEEEKALETQKEEVTAEEEKEKAEEEMAEGGKGEEEEEPKTKEEPEETKQPKEEPSQEEERLKEGLKSPVKRKSQKSPPRQLSRKGGSPSPHPPKPVKTPPSPKKPVSQKSTSPKKKNGTLSPVKTPKAPTTADQRKLPPIKAPVGMAPNPNLKNIKSKIGSFDNIHYKPGGGDKKVTKVMSKKLEWKATSKVGSLDNTSYRPGGGDKKIVSQKVDFKDKAHSKVGSRENAKHQPGGGQVQSSPPSPGLPDEGDAPERDGEEDQEDEGGEDGGKMREEEDPAEPTTDGEGQEVKEDGEVEEDEKEETAAPSTEIAAES